MLRRRSTNLIDETVAGICGLGQKDVEETHGVDQSP